MKSGRIVPLALAAGLSALAGSGCYHYTFELRDGVLPDPGAGNAARKTVTYEERAPTFLNGFVGNGRMDTRKYCAHPVRTELRVTATDVLISAATLLIYTPHTLYVTCETPRRVSGEGSASGR